MRAQAFSCDTGSFYLRCEIDRRAVRDDLLFLAAIRSHCADREEVRKGKAQFTVAKYDSPMDAALRLAHSWNTRADPFDCWALPIGPLVTFVGTKCDYATLNKAIVTIDGEVCDLSNTICPVIDDLYLKLR